MGAMGGTPPPLGVNPEHYERLGVQCDASAPELRAAYAAACERVPCAQAPRAAAALASVRSIVCSVKAPHDSAAELY
eukprot:SAG11_NODE_1721_length_4374_cov_5.296374_4_plen_77_part_00